MKIVDSADWRDRLAYDTPYRVDEIMPGEPARCVSCPAGIDPWDRAALWAVKHRHPKNHAGFVRFYCQTHLPPRPAAAPAPIRESARRAPRATTPRAPRAAAVSVADVVRPMCPECFVEVSATGVCGMCGTQV